ncbi:MAG: arginine--tRNA ligase [Candidatus Falkowbacteria bacterium]
MYSLEKIKIEIAGEINRMIGKDLIQASDLVYPPDAGMGDLSLPCFNPARELKKSPVETARKLGSEFPKIDSVATVSVTGPYLNFKLDKIYFSKTIVTEINKLKDKYGNNDTGKSRRVMIEYSNANTHKEYHIGHLRNLCFGDAVQRILTANGYKSLPVSYINDFGIHAAKTIWWTFHPDNKYAKAVLADLEPEKRGAFLGEMYAASCQREKEDKLAKQMIELVMKKIESRQGEEYELWKKTREWTIEQFDRIYKELGIKFVHIFYESEYIDRGRAEVNAMIKSGLLNVSQGAVIADLEKYKLGVLMFLRSDGTALYPVADLALARTKVNNYELDRSIYVTDTRQSLHFKQLFKVLELSGLKAEMINLGYEFVKLPGGMMSSRSGNVITYEDLRGELMKKALRETGQRHDDWSAVKIETTAAAITLGALKFEMIKVGADQVITYDIDKALKFEGFTAAYLQYAYARIRSIIRKANDDSAEPSVNTDDDKADSENGKEHELIMTLSKYTEAVKKAGEEYDPSEIAKYLFGLAQIFNDYYHAVPVLKTDKATRKARLKLCEAVSSVIKNGLGLLGIGVVEEM